MKESITIIAFILNFILNSTSQDYPIILDKKTFSTYVTSELFEEIQYSEMRELLGGNFFAVDSTYHQFKVTKETVCNVDSSFNKVFHLLIIRSSTDEPYHISYRKNRYCDRVYLVESNLEGEYIQHLEIYHDYSKEKGGWIEHGGLKCSYFPSCTELILVEEKIFGHAIDVDAVQLFDIGVSLERSQFIDNYNFPTGEAFLFPLKNKTLNESSLRRRRQGDLFDLFPLLPYGTFFNDRHKCNITSKGNKSAQNCISYILDWEVISETLVEFLFLNIAIYEDEENWEMSRCCYDNNKLISWTKEYSFKCNENGNFSVDLSKNKGCR